MDIDFILLLKYSKQTEHILIPTDYSKAKTWEKTLHFGFIFAFEDVSKGTFSLV